MKTTVAAFSLLMPLFVASAQAVEPFNLSFSQDLCRKKASEAAVKIEKEYYGRIADPTTTLVSLQPARPEPGKKIKMIALVQMTRLNGDPSVLMDMRVIALDENCDEFNWR